MNVIKHPRRACGKIIYTGPEDGTLVQGLTEVVGEADLDGRSCWRVEMTAVDDTVAYPRRVTWVDKETNIPLKQELYALSGMLLKTWTMGDIQPFEGGRQFPMRMVIEDHVRQGSRTIVEFSNLVFGVELEEEVFSRRWLERN